jgi:peptide deformylase
MQFPDSIELIKYPSKSLYNKCLDVLPEEIDQFRGFIIRMAKACYEFGGFALAANQIGIGKRFFVLNSADERLKEVFGSVAVVNPVIKEKRLPGRWKESCLSVPKVAAWNERFLEIDVEFVNEVGQKKELTLKDLDAVLFQHEVGHLDGELFIDKISSYEKNKVIGLINKLRK